MLRRVFIIGVLGLLVAQPLTAIDFTGKVTPSKAFVLDMTLFGSIELLLDSEFHARAVVADVRVVDVDEVPGLQERLQRLRAVKQQLTGRARR